MKQPNHTLVNFCYTRRTFR